MTPVAARTEMENRQASFTPQGRTACAVALVSAATLLMPAWQPKPLAGALAVGLALALGFARWKAPRSLHGIRGRWVLPARVHALEDVTVGAVLAAGDATPPLVLVAWHPIRKRYEITARLSGLDLQPTRASWITSFPKRGLLVLPPFAVETCQPFGLVAARVPAGSDCELVVFPAVGRIRREFESRIQRWLETHSLSGDPGEDEPAHLRDYRPGDHPHSIHWKASARRRSMLVVERHAAGCRRLALVVDTMAGPNGLKLERLLSAAATLVDHFTGKGWNLTLFGLFAPNGIEAGRDQLLEILALAQAEPGDISALIPEHRASVVLTLRAFDPGTVAAHALVLTLAECESAVLVPPRVR